MIDSSARTPPTSQLFREPGPVMVAVANATEESKAGLCAAGAQVVPVPAADGSVDLQALLKVLGEQEITSLMVEGGGRLVGSLFDLGLVDKVIAYIAPVVLGGRGSPTPVAGAGAATMEEALRLKRTRVDVIGQGRRNDGICEVRSDVYRYRAGSRQSERERRLLSHH